MDFYFEYSGPEMEEFGQLFGVLYSGMLLVSLLIGLALWVLRCYGLYCLAKHRGLQKPWLVWIPVAENWIIGSVSDQYRYLVKGETKSRRKLLLGLSVGNAGLSLITLIAAGVMMASAAGFGGHMSDGQMAAALMGPVMAVLILTGILGLTALAEYVLRQLCMYDLYRSCDPGSATLYLVLGILLSFLEPFFIVANRKKEEGMPPRRIPFV